MGTNKPSNTDEWLGAVKDIGITNIAADPISAVAFVLTGGSGNVAAQTVGKQGLKQALIRTAASDTTKAQTVKGAISAGAWGAAHEDQLQRAEMATGISNDYELNRTVGVGLGSAAAGAALVGSLAKTSKYFKKR